MVGKKCGECDRDGYINCCIKMHMSHCRTCHAEHSNSDLVGCLIETIEPDDMLRRDEDEDEDESEPEPEVKVGW